MLRILLMLHITLYLNVFLFPLKKKFWTKFVYQYHSGVSTSKDSLFVDMMKFLIVKSRFDI